MAKGMTVDIRLFGRDDDLKAYADVTFRVKFGEITVRRFKILAGEDGKVWVAFPQVQYYQLLSVKYVDLLHMNRRVEDFIRRQILLAYHRKTSRGKK